MVLKTKCGQPRTAIFGEPGKKRCQSPRDPQLSVLYVLFVSWAFKRFPSPLCCGEQSQRRSSRSLFCLFSHLRPHQIFIDLLLCARHCSRRFSSYQINRTPQVIVVTAVSQNWEQCQAHTRCSINMCEVDLNRNRQSAGGRHGPFIPCLGNVRKGTGSWDLGQDLTLV